MKWLNNDSWLAAYNPTNFDPASAPESEYFMISREPKTEKYGFQKISDPTPPWGMNRSPPYHFVERLRKFEPHLEDLVIVASTVSGEIGLVTCSTTPLSNDPVAVNAVNKYATTMMGTDTRRAAMPVNPEMMDSSPDTSPIGMALDLSSREPVQRPIPTEEALDQSQSPIPALMILNNEGVLAAWWIIYNDSVKQNTPYHGLAAVSEQQPAPKSAFGTPSSTQPAFGSTTFGAGINKATAVTPTLSSGSAFGSSAIPGSNRSVWGAGSTNVQTAGAKFGQPAFGSTTSLGSGKPLSSPAPAGAAPSSTSGIFGQTPENKQNQTMSSFASLGFPRSENNKSLAELDKKPGDSLFGKPTGANESNNNVFGTQSKPNDNSVFGKPAGQTDQNASPFGNFGKQQNAFGAPTSTGANAPGLSMEPSFGSTLTLPSTMGSSDAPSNVGNNQSPWGTPSLSKTSTLSTKQEARNQDMNLDKPEGMFGSGLSGLQIGDKKEEEPNKAVAQTGKESYKPIGKEQKVHPTGEGKGKEKAALPESKEIEDAPLPLDPTTTITAKKQPEEPPLPPDPAPLPPSPKIKSEPIEDPAPLPPSPKLWNKDQDEGGPSPAGTPPVDLGEAASTSISPARSVGSEDGRAQDGLSLPKPGASQRSKSAQIAPQAEWSFESVPAQTPMKDPTPHEPFSSPLGSLQPYASLTQTPPSSIKPPLYFRPPGQIQESPRSPSPVRTQSQHRSLRRHSPRRASTSPQRRVATSPNRTTPSSNLFNQTPVKSSSHHVTFTPEQPKALPPVEESQSPLSTTQQSPYGKREEDRFVPDPEDDKAAEIARILSQPLYPSSKLQPFQAHQDYVGGIGGQDIPSNIERVYRDINSMLDTLGINARSLASFAKYHAEQYRDGGREREHLEPEEADGWVLAEVEDLGVVLKGVANRLDEERLKDPGPKIFETREMWRSLIRLRSKAGDITKAIETKNDDSRNSPSRNKLTAEQSDTLKDLRNQFAKVQQQLAKAEDAASLLRAKIAAHSPANNADGENGVRKVPTVEAVINTIAKMTRMAEQKRSDLDLLESRMRRLKMLGRETPSMRRSILGASRGAADDEDFGLSKLTLNGRRSASPAFATPPSSRAKRASLLRSTPMSSVRPSESPSYVVPYSCSEDEDESLQRPVSKAQARIEKYMPKVSAEEVALYKARRARRAQVMALLRDKLIDRAGGEDI